MDKILHFFKDLRWQEELQDWIPEHKKQFWIPIILISSFVLQRLSRYFLKRYIDRSSYQMNADPTSFKFLRNMLRFLIYSAAFVSIIYMVPALKKVALSLFASAGIFAAALAFASQAALSNIIGGIFLVIFKPIRVNDTIKIGTDYEGVVEDINLRHTTIRNAENRRIIVPNSVMNSATIVNNNIVDPKTCRYLNIPLNYDAEIEKAIEIIQSLAEGHKDVLDTRSKMDKEQGKPKVDVQIIEFGEYYLQIRAYIWAVNSAMAYDICCELRREILQAFHVANIRIPAQHRNLFISKNVDEKEQNNEDS